MLEKTKINPTFKILSAFGIILIVSGHIPKGGGISFLYEWFSPYSFHITLFVFIAGYFYKEASEEGVLRYLWHKIKRLIIPLYLWNLFYGVFDWLLTFKGFQIGEPINLYNLFVVPLCSGESAFAFNVGGWFASALFFTEVVNLLIRKLFGKSNMAKEIILALFYLAVGITGICLSIKGYNTGLMLVITRVMFFLPFFALGRVYKLYLERLDDKVGNVTYMLILFAIQLIVLFNCKQSVLYTASWSKDFNNGPIVPIITSITGIAFWLRLSKMLTPALKDSRAVRLVADNTYSIMINHFLGFFLFNTLQYSLRHSPIFTLEFSVREYGTNVWCFNIPEELKPYGFIYLFCGIAVPVIIGVLLKHIKTKGKLLLSKRAKNEQSDNAEADAKV